MHVKHILFVLTLYAPLKTMHVCLYALDRLGLHTVLPAIFLGIRMECLRTFARPVPFSKNGTLEAMVVIANMKLWVAGSPMFV